LLVALVSMRDPPKRPAFGSSPREFERALVNGLGRALLVLRRDDPAPYRDAILRACTHYTGYNWQGESTRISYLSEVLQATGDVDSYVEPVLVALRCATKLEHADQLFGLAQRFARAGREDARAAMYDKFDRNDTDQEFQGASELIGLDGCDGLLHVADRIGDALLSAEVDRNTPRHFVNEADEEIGEDEVQNALSLAQKSNPRIRAFVYAATEEATKHEERRREPYVSQPDLRGLSYDEAGPLIASSASLSLSADGRGRWGEDASENDLARAAADLLTQTDPQVLASYLMLFARRPFPLAPEPLLPLLPHPTRRVRVAAYTALSQVQHPKVRARALEILANTAVHGWKRARAVDLLDANYEPGDEILFEQLLRKPRNRWEYHALGTGALDVMKAHPDRSGVPALLSLYERGACSFCRERVVVLLRELGEAPAWMLDECRYDANLDLRETVQGWREA